MSYDGMKIFKYNSGAEQIFEVRGRLVHRLHDIGRPHFEIRDNYIFPYMAATITPMYEIRGQRFIHEYKKTTPALYEFRHYA